MNVNTILKEFRNNSCYGLSSETWKEILDSNDKGLVKCLSDIKNFEGNLSKLQ